MKIDIVIVNWNSGAMLGSCLESLDKYGTNEISKVVLIDNNSTDDSIHNIKKYRYPLHVVENRENIGFGAACNQGAVFCDSKYILIRKNAPII